jgi:hypothetical protein
MYNGYSLEAWKKLAAFQVFGDYQPMAGFRLALRIGLVSERLTRLLETRAGQTDLLDPDLARWSIRAGLGLVRLPEVSFVYATPEDSFAVVRPDLSQRVGAAIEIQNRLLTAFSSRFALLCGRELTATAQIFEFPDPAVLRQALASVAEEVEESTPLRTSKWLGAQLRGRGLPFHPSMVETLEEQTSLLLSNGIDMDSLPSWWWRGVAAITGDDGDIEVVDDLPSGHDFAQLVPE